MGEEGGEILEMKRRRSARIWALEEEKEKKKKKKKKEEVEEQKACATKSNEQMMMMMMIGVPHSEDCEVEERRLSRPPTVRQYDRRRVRKRKRLEDVVVTTSLAYPSHVQVHNSFSLSPS
jgi:predicted NodU family carbamoyl transferase